MQAAIRGWKAASVMQALQSWVPRDNLYVPENFDKQYRVMFNCPVHGRVTSTVAVTCGDTKHECMVAKLVDRVAVHSACCIVVTQDSDPAVVAAATAARDSNDSKRLRTAKRALEMKNEQLEAKLQKLEAASKAQTELKRQESRAASRKVTIDRRNDTPLSIPDKSTAMTTEGTRNPGGLVDCVKYWARGSMAGS